MIQQVINKYFKSVLVSDNQNYYEFIVEPLNNSSVEEAFKKLYAELVGQLSYAVLLFKDSGNYVLRVSKREMRRNTRRRYTITLILSIITIVSVAYAGYLTTQYFNQAVSSLGLSNLRLDTSWSTLLFTLTVVVPIVTHEFSHYLMGRKLMVPVTPPTLIPAPLISPLGTFGAIISMKHLPKSLKDLVRIGLAGPLAGTIASYVLFAIMYILSPIVSYDVVAGAVSKGLLQEIRVLPLGSVLIMKFIDVLRWSEGGMTSVILSPPALAALFIILIHFINLLPLGQLDGGHVIRGLTDVLIHRLTGLVTLVAALITTLLIPDLLWLGIFVVVAFLITGLREHPGSSNMLSKLKRAHKLRYFIIYAVLLTFTAPIII